MGGRFRLPMFVVAAAMAALMALLATLQYRWLGRISDAERERMRSTLNTRAAGFAHDFDRELTRAYLLFQFDATPGEDGTAARLSARYDRWQATARFPRLIRGIYLASVSDTGVNLQRFDPSTRLVGPAEWPSNLRQIQEQVARLHRTHAPGRLPRPLQPPMVLDDVPAIVAPSPLLMFTQRGAGDVRFTTRVSYTILLLDREYLVGELLPALAEGHFRGAGEGFDYQLAVVRSGTDAVLYRSSPDFRPSADAAADAAVDLFQVQLQQFPALTAEVRRFVTFTTVHRMHADARRSIGASDGKHQMYVAGTVKRLPPDHLIERGPEGIPPGNDASPGGGATPGRPIEPRWKLLVTHPAGSLDAAVQAVRRRNVLVSSGILALLGASMGLLVLSTRRAQRLAAQQMEFVAAISHELRTPLAVIRSAGENLADGVVRSDDQIRKYGDLVRGEGRRLTEMVEQILEFAGIQSGQRGFALRPIAVRRMLDDIVEASGALIGDAGLTVDVDVPPSLPPVLGDEAALRRAFQNLIGNAIKYGATGGWIGLTARDAGREVHVTVSDRGIGIAPAEHARIFEPFYRTPDVVAAQVHGAGLGLSLVKRIVEAHGGRVVLASTPGSGSQFTVQLPAAGPEAISADAGQPHREAAPAAGVRT